jgi:hypothetical protein
MDRTYICQLRGRRSLAVFRLRFSLEEGRVQDTVDLFIFFMSPLLVRL